MEELIVTDDNMIDLLFDGYVNIMHGCLVILKDVKKLTITFNKTKNLFCHNVKIEELNIDALTNLKCLHCVKTNIKELHIEKLTNLTHLFCYDNKLSNLNIKHNHNLRYLYCSGNNFDYVEYKDRLILVKNDEINLLNEDYIKNNSIPKEN